MATAAAAIVVRFRRFCPDQMDSRSSCLITGARTSGKTTLATHIVNRYQLRRCHDGYVGMVSEGARASYSGCIWQNAMHSNTLGTLAGLLRKISVVRSDAQRRLPATVVGSHPVFLVWDEVPVGGQTDPMCRALIAEGKQHGVGFVAVLQGVDCTTPDIRRNTDYLFIKPPSDPCDRMRLWALCFAHQCPDRIAFGRAVDQLLAQYPYAFLVATVPSSTHVPPASGDICELHWIEARPDLDKLEDAFVVALQGAMQKAEPETVDARAGELGQSTQLANVRFEDAGLADPDVAVHIDDDYPQLIKSGVVAE